MLFLEDLYASKRPTVPEKRSSATRQPRTPRREHLPPPPLPPLPPQAHLESRHAAESLSVPVERHERASSTKRNSIFSRRRSTATNSSSDSQKRNSTLSAGAASRRSSLAEMAVVDGESLKSKLLFGFHTGKKSGRTKSDATNSDDFAKESSSRQGHFRGGSVDSKDQVSVISAPYGFQHIARIERPRRSSIDNNVLYETNFSPPNHAIPMNSPQPPQELQSSLARRAQKIPPPLRPVRPQRPDESQIPDIIRSPPYGLPSLRQIRSTETFNAPPVSQQPGSPSFSPPMATGPLPPRRSSRRAPYHFDEPKPTLVAQQPTANDLGLSSEWDRLLPLYNSRPGNHREAQVIQYNQSIVQPDSASIPKSHPSPLFSPPLEQVPEEPEGLNTPRDSKELGRNTSLRHAKSSPNMSRSGSASRLITQSSTIPKMPELPKVKEARPVSQGSDTLGDITHRSFLIKMEEDSSRTRPSNGSWEEDVDFCYKHAAEANCNFDWNNVSRFLDTESSDDEPEFMSALAKVPPTLKKQQSGSTESSEDVENFHNKSFFHQSMISGPEGLPDLDYHSVHTGSSNSLAVATPHAISSGEVFKPPKSEEIILFTSPQLPPLDLRGDLDSDQLYEELMVGFTIKEAQQQFLPMLEPKAYSPTAPQKSLNFSPQIGQNASPVLKQRRFSNDRSKIQLPPPPTSAPATSMTQQPLITSMSKELPPLPDPSPSSSPRLVAPATLRVENLVAQLRSPRESPTDSKITSFTPPSSNKPSPIPDQFPLNPAMRRRPTRTTENPMVKIQELSPEMLSRNGSEDTVVTTIFVPATPPDSPDQRDPFAPLLAPTHAPKLGSSRIPVPMSQRMLRHSPSLPTMRQPEMRKAAPDNALNSPPGSPFGQSPTSPRLNYSLFPPQSRPGRPRRLTTT